MSTSVSSVTNHFPSAENSFGTTTTSGITSGDTTVYLASLDGYDNGEVIVFVVDPTDATKKQAFTGVVNTGTLSITSVVWTSGTNQNHVLGATVVDYATATHISMISKGLSVSLDQDGTLKAGAVDVAAVLASNVVTTAKILDSNVTTAKIADDSVTAAKLDGIDKSLLTTDSNPYKFLTYRNAAQSTTATTAIKINFDTKLYDTNNNFDAVTNRRYTVPVSGFYWFYGRTSAITARLFLQLFKNGTVYARGGDSSGSGINGVTLGILMQCTAGDYFELFVWGQTSVALEIGSADILTYFGGYLVSRT